LSTRLTVPREMPAAAATSWTVARLGLLGVATEAV